MIKKFNFDYDYKNDSLFIYDPKTKSKASVDMDDIIIDFNSKKELSSIELLNASKMFKEIKLTKKKLSEINNCKLNIIPKNNFFMIVFWFTFSSKEKISTQLYLPSVNEPRHEIYS